MFVMTASYNAAEQLGRLSLTAPLECQCSHPKFSVSRAMELLELDLVQRSLRAGLVI